MTKRMVKKRNTSKEGTSKLLVILTPIVTRGRGRKGRAMSMIAAESKHGNTKVNQLEKPRSMIIFINSIITKINAAIIA